MTWLDATHQAKFKGFANWLKNQLPNVSENERVWRSFISASGLRELEAFIAVSPGAPSRANPQIVVKPMAPFGRFEIVEPNRVFLQESFVTRFEGDLLNIQKSAAAHRMMEATILHELCHWADGRDGALNVEVELGYEFERAAYDQIVGPYWDDGEPSGECDVVPRPDAIPATELGTAGYVIIKHFEGLRLEAYRDAVGIWTIGYGHTRDVHAGARISEARADELLTEDAQSAIAGVRRKIRVPLNQNQFDALVSWTFNLGEENLQESTLRRRLNKRFYREVPSEMKRWNKAGGRVLEGLVRRRAAEADLWNGVLRLT